MKILVTGGAGCIGSDLAEALLRRGDEVTAFDNLSSGKLENVEPLRMHERFRFVQGDLLDTVALERSMAGVDMVYHMAANPDVKFTEGDATDKDLQQNTIATYNVLEAMRRCGVGRLAFASTSAVYGVSEVQPIPEAAVARPISLYGATKLGCEALITAFSNLFGMQVWIFRFANVVGAKVRKTGRTVISDFIARLREDPARLTILGDGRQAKSYLLASECIEAMLFVIAHAREKVNVYIAAYGGLQLIRFHPDGHVAVDPVICRAEARRELNRRLLMFFTGGTRPARDILTHQVANTPNSMPALRKLSEIAFELRDILTLGRDLNDFGRLLHTAWELKRSLEPSISNPRIDQLYERGLKAGAIGGKLLGAGGSGFLLFFCEPHSQDNFRRELRELRELTFSLEPEGTKVIHVGSNRW